MKNILVTIDGPAASGKGKIANYLSKKWKLKHLDSGLLYRRLALLLIKDKIDTGDISEIKKKIYNIKKISFHRNSRRELIMNLLSSENI